MSANIEFTNGKYSFAESRANATAWHKLGQTFERKMYVREAIVAAQADYKVSLQPIMALSPTLLDKVGRGESIAADEVIKAVIKDHKATMRADTENVLGITSDTYGVVQNEEAFKFIDLLCSGDIADRDHTPTIEACGVLGHGERIFITCQMPQRISIGAKDEIQPYIVFTTSHDGTGAVVCMVTNVRVVCQNTLNYAFRHNSGKISFRHTRYVGKRMDLLNADNAKHVYATLGLYDEYQKEFKSSLEHLANIKLAEKDLDNILAEVALSDKDYQLYKADGINAKDIATRGRNKFFDIKSACESGIGQNLLESGTGLWAVNGLTTYLQNVANYRGDENKLQSLTDGTGQRMLQKMYNLVATY